MYDSDRVEEEQEEAEPAEPYAVPETGQRAWEAEDEGASDHVREKEAAVAAAVEA